MLIIDFVYLVYLIIVSPYYLLKFITSEYHRKGLLERFGFIPLQRDNNPCIWLHAASVGEINASEILIKCLRETYPDYKIVISTTTPSAQKLVRDKYPDIKTFFFPIDLSIIIKKVLKLIKPALIILIEQELWLNLIRIASSKKIPIILLNGRITKHSVNRYHLIKPIIKPIWNKVSFFCVQNKEYSERFQALGIKPDKVKITGNMKYDLLNRNSLQTTPPEAGLPMAQGSNKKTASDDLPASPSGGSYREIFCFNKDDLVIIGGSTHSPEEDILLEVYSNLKQDITNLRLLIAPRHPFRFDEVEKLIRAKGFACLRRSKPIPNPESRIANHIVLLDTVGELVKVYSIADVVVVGGSFVPRGGQSILEPAASGKPVLFGPDMSNFQDMADLLIKQHSAIAVADKTELYQQLSLLLKEPMKLKEMGCRAKDVISQYQGATTKNIEFIRNIIPPRI